MKVVITGGTGLIGCALTRSLATDGHEVVVLTRNPQKARNLPAGVKVVGWDGRTAQGWLAHAEGADAIVNLAGTSIAGEGFPPTRWTASRKQSILQSRLAAAAAVVEAVSQAKIKPKTVIQASAVGYYGSTDRLVDEGAPAGTSFDAQVCVDWEQAIEPVRAQGVRVATIRTGVVLSMDGGAFPSLLIPFKMIIAGGPLGSGSQGFSWIHTDDEVRAIRFLIEYPDAEGVYNLTAPKPVSNGEMARIIGRVMGRPAIMPTPGFALRLALGEVAGVLLDGQFASSKKLEAAGFNFTYPDAEQAVRALFGKPAR
ncbi:MAG: TIGR01777 family oxidoreductase [Anaerolineae bacterium]|nr:TIGR01777 family oxidoreductase [Anaerolineae bacterium]